MRVIGKTFLKCKFSVLHLVYTANTHFNINSKYNMRWTDKPNFHSAIILCPLWKYHITTEVHLLFRHL